MEDPEKTLLFGPEAVSARVGEMAQAIRDNHPREDILFVGILKGSFIFLADLIREIGHPCQVDFARIASYGSGTVSSGRLNISLDISMPVAGRTVILVDDIVDSGLTLHEYKRVLQTKQPRSLEIAALIDKTGRRNQQVELDYYGFRIEEGFLVGYGLDCDEQYRSLPGIYELKIV